MLFEAGPLLPVIIGLPILLAVDLWQAWKAWMVSEAGGKAPPAAAHAKHKALWRQLEAIEFLNGGVE